MLCLKILKGIVNVVLVNGLHRLEFLRPHRLVVRKIGGVPGKGVFGLKRRLYLPPPQLFPVHPTEPWVLFDVEDVAMAETPLGSFMSKALMS